MALIDFLNQSDVHFKTIFDHLRSIDSHFESYNIETKSVKEMFSQLFQLQSLFEKNKKTFSSSDPVSTQFTNVLESILVSSIELRKSKNIKEVLNKSIDSLLKFTHAGRGVLVLIENNKILNQLTYRNVNPDELDSLKNKISSTVLKHTIDTKQPTILNKNDFTKDLLEQSSIIEIGASPTICYPIIYENDTIGAIYLDRFTQIDPKSIEITKIFVDQLASVIDQYTKLDTLKRSKDTLLNELRGKYSFDGIICSSKKMTQVLKTVSKVADTQATILIQGESGTGKDLIARALHENSSRRSNEYIEVDCGALPATLIESELFGHKKGAFTGAQNDKMGLLEVANEGTIFLDEINNMPFDTQAKLLRVLQTKRFRRIGDTVERESNFRLIVASSKDLQTAVKKETFREDLFYRINTITLVLPPLREREGDILELSMFFKNKYSNLYGKEIEDLSKHFISTLESHAWKGNVRELENVIERAVILSETKTLSVEDLPNQFNEDQKNTMTNFTKSDNLESFVNKQKKNFIEYMLKECKGKKVETAKKLGIDRSHLFTLMKKLNIS